MDYIESGMDFSPLFTGKNSDKSIYIEKSIFLKKAGEGVRTVEFVTLRRKNELQLIEAKTTAPNLNTPGNNENINMYYQKIVEKVQHTIDLLASKEIGIRQDSAGEFPECFNSSIFVNTKMIFLLIINNSKEEWCEDIQTDLQHELMHLKRIWGMEVLVLNREDALKYKLITDR